MDTQQIWERFNNEIYFFILKKVKDTNAANDILQNTFLKIHNNLHQLKEPEKARAWAFQIARNELVNFHNKETKYVGQVNDAADNPTEDYEHACCFDNFIENLPETYKEAIELVYIDGKKQNEASQALGISLANVKARIRRGKNILKQKFKDCCKYQFDNNGNLIGEADCAKCGG